LARTPEAAPMSLQEVSDDGTVWFMSDSDSHRNAALDISLWAELFFFLGSEHSDFLDIMASATISKDKKKVKALWNPILKTWFTDGEDDPRITVLKVVPESGYYWNNKHGNLGAGATMLIAAAIGKRMDDSIEGRLHFLAVDGQQTRLRQKTAR
jgi:general stress protein 26